MRVTFNDLRMQRRSNELQFEGRTVFGVFDCTVSAGEIFRLEFARHTRGRVQGVALKVKDGLLDSDGFRSSHLRIWKDTASGPVTVTCVQAPPGATLEVWNVWEGYQGELQAWTGNAGIVVEEHGPEIVLHCSDGPGPPSFDDLVLRLEFERPRQAAPARPAEPTEVVPSRAESTAAVAPSSPRKKRPLRAWQGSRRGDSALPTFTYHPDPVATGSIVRAKGRCRACNQARGHLYVGPVYTAHDLEEGDICPWCIADGTAARMYGIAFTGISGGRGWADIDEEVKAEVLHRTPGFSGWQQEQWEAHCGDAAVFLGRVGWPELFEAGPDAVQSVGDLLARDGLTMDQIRDYLARLSVTGPPTAYLFRCRHCGTHVGYSDGL